MFEFTKKGKTKQFPNLRTAAGYYKITKDAISLVLLMGEFNGISGGKL